MTARFCLNMWLHSHTKSLSISFFLSLSLTHTHTHLSRKRENLAVRHHNYSTNCCSACCWPTCNMSQRSHDSFELLIMQFLWSALLAHASHNLCAAAADGGNCGNNCLSFLVGFFDVWRRDLFEL